MREDAWVVFSLPDEVHVAPRYDDQHVLHRNCWCHPEVSYIDPDTGIPYTRVLVTHHGCDEGK